MYFGSYEQNSKKDGTHCWWWLRTIGADEKSGACVWGDGSVHPGGYACNKSGGAVRPVIVVSADYFAS